MQKSNLNLAEPRVPNIRGSLLVLVGFLLIGMAVGNILAVFILTLFLSADSNGVIALLNQLNTEPEKVQHGWYMMMILQGTVHFFSYLLPSLLFWRFVERKPLSGFQTKENPQAVTWVLAFLLVLVFIPINSKFIEWNLGMKLPQAFSGIENWMREKEEQLSVLTNFVTDFKGIGQFLIAMFVVVFLAGTGEEMLFRGIIQRKLFQQTGNIHISILVSAAIFSAIHLQFYGFFPRMLLGAVFGYLYYWTGSLMVSIMAHFINNGFILLMVYLYHVEIISINIEEIKTMPLTAVLLPLVFTFVILYMIRKGSLKQRVTV